MTTKSHISDEPDPDVTGPKQALTQFKPGQSGNPKGRPKGARSRLGEQFIQALADDFEVHGEAVIEKVRNRDPVAYVKVIKDTLPREILVQAFTAHASVDLSQIESARGFLEAYRFARDRIGAVPLIEAEPIHADEGAVHTEAWKSTDDD